MTHVVAQLLRMTKADLDALFSASPSGPIPEGRANGTAIIAPGTSFSPKIARLISHFAWQGKVFNPSSGTPKNRIGPFSLKAIVARVYKDASWLDQKECIVLDYSETSQVAHWIRDEIRLIAAGRRVSLPMNSDLRGALLFEIGPLPFRRPISREVRHCPGGARGGGCSGPAWWSSVCLSLPCSPLQSGSVRSQSGRLQPCSRDR